MQLGWLGDNSRHALDKDAPPTPSVGVIAVSFKGEDSAGGGCVKLCAFHGAEYDFAVREGEVDWQNCWKCVDAEASPLTDTLASRSRHSRARTIFELWGTHSFTLADGCPWS